MGITINGVTALRVGMRVTPTATDASTRAWIRRVGLYKETAPGVFAQVSFKTTEATYTATQDTGKLGVPFQQTESGWWGESINKTGFAYHTATLNPGIVYDGIVRCDLVYETTTINPLVDFIVEVQRGSGNQWERIFTFVASTTNGAYQTKVQPSFEPQARMVFRHKGEPLAGWFNGWYKSGGSVSGLVGKTNQDNTIEFLPELSDVVVYGTFIPDRADLMPKIIGPIRYT